MDVLYVIASDEEDLLEPYLKHQKAEDDKIKDARKYRVENNWDQDTITAWRMIKKIAPALISLIYAGYKISKSLKLDREMEKTKKNIVELGNDLGASIDVNIEGTSSIGSKEVTVKMINKNEKGENIQIIVKDKLNSKLELDYMEMHVSGDEGAKKGYDTKFAAVVSAYMRFIKEQAKRKDYELKVIKK